MAHAEISEDEAKNDVASSFFQCTGLMRYKRCSSVEQLDDNHWRYAVDVFDALEMLPWIGRLQVVLQS